jgi:hypothetical protein
VRKKKQGGSKASLETLHRKIDLKNTMYNDSYENQEILMIKKSQNKAKFFSITKERLPEGITKGI